MRKNSMVPVVFKPGRMRRRTFITNVVTGLTRLRAAVSGVCDLTEAEWRDAFQRDANPEHELLWWERVSRCYTALIERRPAPDQCRAFYTIIFGLFSGAWRPTKGSAPIAKLPESIMDDLAKIVRAWYTVNSLPSACSDCVCAPRGLYASEKLSRPRLADVIAATTEPWRIPRKP